MGLVADPTQAPLSPTAPTPRVSSTSTLTSTTKVEASRHTENRVHIDNTTAIAGGVVGGVFVILGAILIGTFFMRKHREKGRLRLELPRRWMPPSPMLGAKHSGQDVRGTTSPGAISALQKEPHYPAEPVVIPQATTPAHGEDSQGTTSVPSGTNHLEIEERVRAIETQIALLRSLQQNQTQDLLPNSGLPRSDISHVRWTHISTSIVEITPS